MGFRLAVLLGAIIFAAMYFAPTPEPRPQVQKSPAPEENLTSAAEVPAPVETQPAVVADIDTQATDSAVIEALEAQLAEPTVDAQNSLTATDNTAATDVDNVDPETPAIVPGLGLGSLARSNSADALDLAESVRQRLDQDTPQSPDLSRPTLPGAQIEAPEEPPEELAETSPSVAAAPDQLRGQVTGNSVNMRSGPSTNEPVMGRANAGDILRVTDNSLTNGWIGVANPENGNTVYMASRFLQVLP